jgi:RNA binding exosome subunit
MFNFFNKKEPEDLNELEQDDENILASITYLVKQDEKGALIDVQLRNFENESIEALSSLLDVLGNDGFYIDTINMIRNSLSKEGKYEVLANILSKLELKIRQKILDSAKDRIKDEPYIKPSEMFK